MLRQTDLPAAYIPAQCFDLQSNKKLRYGILLACTLVAAVMVLYGNTLYPLRRYFRGSMDQIAYAFIGIILYMILHEMVHGLFMWGFGGQMASCRHHGLLCFARSEILFDKKHYYVICLSPIVIWGVILAILCGMSRHTDWFWTFYFIEIINISGACSDVFILKKLSSLPKDVMILDDGTAITIYKRNHR